MQIEFRLHDNDKMRGVTVDACVQSFGMTRAEANRAYDQSATIRCRPEQFGLFIVRRNDLIVASREEVGHTKGMCNRISVLEPQIVESQPAVIIDVSASRTS